MADRTVATTNTLNYFRHEFNATAADVGSIQSILDAAGIIASATDIPTFAVFQLKTVLTGSNSSYPPLIKDMRGIALAV